MASRNNMINTGLIVVVSGPAGCGKGSVLQQLVSRNRNVRLSVSATTRNPRQGEKDGQHYHFKTKTGFKEMIRKERLVEWVEFCGNYYGTPVDEVSSHIKTGCDVILEIEVEGSSRIRDRYPESVHIFIVPPGFEELRRRLKKRGSENCREIESRLERAMIEMNHALRYDYIVINDNIDSAVSDMECILRAEKLKPQRNAQLLRDLKIRSMEG